MALLFNSLQESMAGVYYCAASYSVTEQLAASVLVETYGKFDNFSCSCLDEVLTETEQCSLPMVRLIRNRQRISLRISDKVFVGYLIAIVVFLSRYNGNFVRVMS